MIADRHQLADFWKWMVHIVHNFCQSFAESSFPIYTTKTTELYAASFLKYFLIFASVGSLSYIK